METKKSSSANIEAGKSIFFKIGLILTLIMVFSAFQYRSYDRPDAGKFTGPAQIYDVDIIPITIPKPPTPPAVKAAEIIITPFDTPEDEPFEPLDVEGYGDISIPDIDFDKYTKDEKIVDEEVIFHHPETQPEFPGGLSAMYAFLGNNLDYPRAAKDNNITGTVFIGFVIEKDGTVSNVHVLRGIGGGCDEEAVRVVSSMPRWNPGKMGILPVRCSFSLPIRFQLN